jgi:hypothetical protein
MKKLLKMKKNNHFLQKNCKKLAITFDVKNGKNR